MSFRKRQTTMSCLTTGIALAIWCCLSPGCGMEPPPASMPVPTATRPALAPVPATAPAPEIIGLMGAFALHPDEAHFREILLRAEHSDDPRLIAVWDYDRISAYWTPVHPGTDVSASVKRLKDRVPADFILLEEIMIRHDNPWRQWTAAKLLGRHGGKECVPKLRVLLGSEYDFVRKYAAEAIDEIDKR